MKLATGIAIAALLSLFAVRAQAQDRVQAAGEAAGRWLELVDSGKAGESWTEASPSLRAAVSREQWAAALESVRSPLGPVRSRTQQSATLTRSLPGAPAGEYVVIQYRTSFAGGIAIETVTPMREPDGSWKVSGYYVK
ncbi:DUF4019 domain-containing protein [Massilia niastensis]|uniref:DUF4019 domain-containing protein n=1 Tax=Massilia niastensis TaxID=544911 RepID=UPI00037FD0B0|nr:DUF4019 domain-containing protein [Massilia niastensis]